MSSRRPVETFQPESLPVPFIALGAYKKSLMILDLTVFIDFDRHSNPFLVQRQFIRYDESSQ